MADSRANELMQNMGALARNFLMKDRKSDDSEIALTPLEVRTLATIGEAGRPAMGWLARELGVSGSAMTAVMDRLVEKGVVRRVMCADDRRVVNVELTTIGRGRFETRRKERLRMAEAMLAALEPEEQDVFVKLMARIREKALGENAGRRK